MADKKLPTVRGIAVYPKLTEPDTKFKAEGEYSTKLRLTAEDGERLTALCESVRQEAVEKKIEEQAAKGKKISPDKIKLADLPVTPEVDDEGNETGYYLATFKALAKGVSKATGKAWARKIPLFDARRNPIKPGSIDIWSGSELCVAFEPNPYNSPLVGAGAALRLQAVQVLKLVEGGHNAANSFADEGDDGYTHAAPESSASIGADDGAEDF